MKVHVQATDLRAYAGLLERNAAYPDGIWAYVAANTHVPVRPGGMLNLVCGGHERVRDNVHSICVDLAGLLERSGRRLHAAAGWYDRADETAWQRIDKLNISGSGVPGNRVPAPPRTTRVAPESSRRHSPGRARGRYRDVADPQRRLDPPTAGAFQDPNEPFAMVLDRYRGAPWAAGAVKAVCGRDLVGELGREFVGDWEAWSRAGRVWEQVGRAMSDLARNLESGNLDLEASWNGQAAYAAHLYFARFASQVGAQREAFEALKAGYDFYLAFAYTTASFLADLARELFDVLAGANPDSSAAVPVAVYQAAGAGRICDQISRLLTAAHATARAINALIIGRSRMLYRIREALPLESYALEGV